MSNPAVILDSQGRPQCFFGPAGVDFFRMKVMLSALKLLKVGISPNRAYTKTRCLAEAAKYTGQTYKRGQIDKAIADLEQAITARAQVLSEEGVIQHG